MTHLHLLQPCSPPLHTCSCLAVEAPPPSTLLCCRRAGALRGWGQSLSHAVHGISDAALWLGMRPRRASTATTGAAWSTPIMGSGRRSAPLRLWLGITDRWVPCCCRGLCPACSLKLALPARWEVIS